MPQLLIRFHMQQVGTESPARAAFSALIGAVTGPKLALCSVHHGFMEQDERYCLAIHSDNPRVLPALYQETMAAQWPPQMQPHISMDEGPLRTQSMALAARFDGAGNLVDANSMFSALWTQRWGSLLPPSPAPAPPGAPFPFETRAPRLPVYSPQQPEAAPPRVEARPVRSDNRFPRSAPGILTKTMGRGRGLDAFLGMSLGIIASMVIFVMSPRDSMLFKIFDLRELSTLIPVAVLCMFFWGAALCFTRWRRVGAIEQVSKRAALEAVVAVLGPGCLQESSAGNVVRVSPLLRRAEAVIDQWFRRPSLQDADVILQQLAAGDEEEVHAGYSLVRTFVWALPVLGLIGTVIGISLAVGGFADFLGGNIEDVNIIKQNLVNVTGGLSFAFLITLEGLVTSLLLMLAASGLQTRERELYSRVQGDVADMLIPALQRIAPEQSGSAAPGGPSAGGLIDVFLQAATEVTRKLAETGENILLTMNEKQAAWITSLESAGARILKQSADSQQQILQSATREAQTLVAVTANGLQETARGFASHLTQSGEQVRTSLADAASSVAAHLVQDREHATAQFETIRASFSDLLQIQQGLVAKLGEQTAAIHNTGSGLDSLAQTASQALSLQKEVQQNLLALDAGRLESLFGGFTNALNDSTRTMTPLVQSSEALARMTAQLIAAQAAVQMATQQLADQGLTEALNGLRDALAKLNPVLANFQRPFVLQAVPATNSQG